MFDTRTGEIDEQALEIQPDGERRTDEPAQQPLATSIALTPLIDSTATAQGSVEPTATRGGPVEYATAAPRAAETGQVGGEPPLRASGFTDPQGELHILGEVANASSQARVAILAAVLKDGQGTILSQVAGRPPVEAIPPGGKAPFEILTQLPDGYASYELSVEWLAAEREVRDDLVIEDVSSSGQGGLRVRGTIHNPGEDLKEYAEILAVVYDVSGGVVGLGAAFLEAADLAAGNRAAFEVEVIPVREGAVRFSVWAVGY